MLVGLGLGSGRSNPVVLEFDLGAIVISAVLSGVVMIWRRFSRR
jgi:hypothetical protein